MTLGFKQQFPWATKDKPAPTNFRDKILAGVGKIKYEALGQTFILDIARYNQEARFSGKQEMTFKIKPKIHTMRADPTSRWKAGRKIEMVYRGAGYKIIDHFNKGIPELQKCVSVQKIEIKVHPYGSEGGSIYDISIDDGPMLTRKQASVLATNDGFDSLYDFEKWFNKDFTGKIIHFTNFRY